MADINGIKIEPNFNLKFGKSNSKKGGKGGEVFLFSRNITGSGEIITDGGDGEEGGDAGGIKMISENNTFSGKISSKGGKSHIR